MLGDVRVMRGSAAFAAMTLVGLGLAGCLQRSEPPAQTESGGSAECAADHDCAGAGDRCCDCPAFAVPITDASYRACSGVSCPDMHCPHNVRAACDRGRCVLACVAMECRQSCAFGFAADASGCLTCQCAAPPSGGCVAASDCVQVRSDCCGCKRGGRDTAVLRDDADAFDAALGCPAAPQCPSREVCEPAVAPQCVQGKCVLAADDGLPSAACGRRDLDACGAAEVCVVNGPDARVNEQGLGLCMSAPDPLSP